MSNILRCRDLHRPKNPYAPSFQGHLATLAWYLRRDVSSCRRTLTCSRFDAACRLRLGLYLIEGRMYLWCKWQLSKQVIADCLSASKRCILRVSPSHRSSSRIRFYCISGGFKNNYRNRLWSRIRVPNHPGSRIPNSLGEAWSSPDMKNIDCCRIRQTIDIIGMERCRQCLRYHPKIGLIVEISEKMFASGVNTEYLLATIGMLHSSSRRNNSNLLYLFTLIVRLISPPSRSVAYLTLLWSFFCCPIFPIIYQWGSIWWCLESGDRYGHIHITAALMRLKVKRYQESPQKRYVVKHLINLVF